MVHSNGRQRTEKDGDAEKRCQKLSYRRKLLTMVKTVKNEA